MTERSRHEAASSAPGREFALSEVSDFSGADLEPGSGAPITRNAATNGRTPKGPVLASPTTTGADFQKTVVPGLMDKQRYKVTGEFARGGMGRILLAFDRATGREVAVKELIGSAHAADPVPAGGKLEATGPTIMGGPSMIPGEQPALTSPPPDDITIERFLREAKITSRLEHPNIVPVYEIAQRPDGVWYYSMKFVRGVTLGKRLRDIGRNGQLDEKAKREERLKLLGAFVDVCNAIAYADSKGVVHRDLKPENIMLGEFGETVILDWGLARVEGEDLKAASQILSSKSLKTRGAKSKPNASDTPGRSSSRLTLDGSVLGTPSYMPVEQALGKLEQVDHCSDVYSLGAILYEILSGVRACPGEDAFDILDAVLAGPPLPLAQVSPDVPPELVAVVEKAMAREKTQRFTTARELASEIEAWRNGRAVASYRYSTGEQIRRVVKRHRAVVTTVMAAMLVMLVGGVIALWSINAEKNEAERQASVASAAKVDAERQATAASAARQLSDDRLAEVNRLEAEKTGRFARLRQARIEEFGVASKRANSEYPLDVMVTAASGLLAAWEASGLTEPTPVIREQNLEATTGLLKAIEAHEAALELAVIPIDGQPPGVFSDNPEFDSEMYQSRVAKVVDARLVAISIASANGDFALARHVLRSTAIGMDEGRRSEVARKIDESEGARLAHRRKRIAFVLDDVQKGLGREGRAWDSKLLDDYVFELVQYKDDQTAELLGEAMLVQAKKAGWVEGGVPTPTASEGGDSGVAGAGLGSSKPEETGDAAYPRQNPKEVLWTQEERDVVTMCCRVLARVGLGEPAVAALTPFSEVVLDHGLAVEVGLALGYTGHVSAWGPIDRFHDRLGKRSSAAKVAQKSTRFLPLPPLGVPADAKAYSRRAITRFHMGDLDGAMGDFNTAIGMDPTVAASYGNRGMVFSAMGDLPAALADYDKAVELNPKVPTALHKRGVVRLQMNDFAGAIVDFEKAMEIDSSFVNSYVSRGDARKNLGDFKGAIADYGTAISMDPENDAAYVNRGNLLRDQGDLIGALADFERAVMVAPWSALGYLNRGDIRERMGDRAGAIADTHRAIELDPKSATAFMFRGLLHAGMGDLVAALADYDRAVQLDPKNVAAFSNRGNSRRKAGDLGGALADLDKAIELDPSLPYLFVNRAMIRRAMGDLAGALSDCNQAIHLDSNIALAYSNRGLVRSDMGELEAAVADCEHAIRLNPKLADAHTQLGAVWLELGDLTKSLASFARAIELEPTNSGHYSNRGAIRLKLGDHAGALADHDRAVELAPKSSHAHAARGRARSESGDKQGAMADFNRAIELDPKNADAYGGRANIRWVPLRDRQGAIDDYDIAIALNPENAGHYAARGVVRHFMGDFVKAFEDLDRAIELDPKNQLAHLFRGPSRVKQGFIERGIEDLEMAIKLFPQGQGLAFELERARSLLAVKPWLTKDATSPVEHFHKANVHAVFAPLEKDKGHWDIAERECHKGMEGVDAILRSAAIAPAPPKVLSEEEKTLLHTGAAICHLLGEGLYKDKQFARGVVWYDKAIGLRAWLLDAMNTAYNGACSAALAAGEVPAQQQGYADKAFEWLSLSAELGYADPKHAASDPDLKSLHSDTRWASFMEKISANAAKVAKADGEGSKADEEKSDKGSDK